MLTPLSEYNITTKNGIQYTKQNPYEQHEEIATMYNDISAKPMRLNLNTFKSNFATADDYLAALTSYVTEDFTNKINEIIDVVNNIEISPNTTAVNDGSLTIQTPSYEETFTANQSFNSYVDLSSIMTFYGTCATINSLDVKTVTLTEGNVFHPIKGIKLIVKFDNTNTSSTVTKIKLGTAVDTIREIYYNGEPVLEGVLLANHEYLFVYDGTHWILNGDVTIALPLIVNNDNEDNKYISNIIFDEDGNLVLEKKDVVTTVVPDTLPNPNSLKIIYNNETTEYDGSKSITLDLGNSSSSIIVPNDNLITIRNANNTDEKYGSFTLNQNTDDIVDIPIPTKISELTNDKEYVNASYIGNGKITLQNTDGNNYGSFNVNQQKDTIITIPSNTYNDATETTHGLMSIEDKKMFNFLSSHKVCVLDEVPQTSLNNFTDATLTTYLNYYITDIVNNIDNGYTDFVLLREKSIDSNNLVINTSFLRFDDNNTDTLCSLEFSKTIEKLGKALLCKGIDYNNNSKISDYFLNNTITIRAIVSTSYSRNDRLIYRPFTYIKTEDRTVAVSTTIDTFANSSINDLVDDNDLIIKPVTIDKYYDVLITLSFKYKYDTTNNGTGLLISTHINYNESDNKLV